MISGTAPVGSFVRLPLARLLLLPTLVEVIIQYEMVCCGTPISLLISCWVSPAPVGSLVRLPLTRLLPLPESAKVVSQSEMVCRGTPEGMQLRQVTQFSPTFGQICPEVVRRRDEVAAEVGLGLPGCVTPGRYHCL